MLWFASGSWMRSAGKCLRDGAVVALVFLGVTIFVGCFFLELFGLVGLHQCVKFWASGRMAGETNAAWAAALPGGLILQCLLVSVSVTPWFEAWLQRTRA